MIIIEDLDNCIKYIGRNIKYENEIYTISSFNKDCYNGKTNFSYYLEISTIKNGETLDEVLYDKEIRPFFQKCEWVD